MVVVRFSTEKELYDVVGRNIKKYRLAKGMTQERLCKQAAISLSYLGKVEAPHCHKSISLASLNQIANALNEDLTKFFENTEI